MSVSSGNKEENNAQSRCSATPPDRNRSERRAARDPRRAVARTAREVHAAVARHRDLQRSSEEEGAAHSRASPPTRTRHLRSAEPPGPPQSTGEGAGPGGIES